MNAGGMTLADLAKRSGVSKGYLSDVENGRHNITIEKARAIATALGVSLHEITGD